MIKRHFHRRNLPHLYYNDGIYFITYRLADSLPREFVAELKEELKTSNKNFNDKDKRYFKKYDDILDSLSYGKKYLSIPEIAYCNQQILHKYEMKEYKIICYTIMPNHIHLVIELLKGNKGVSVIMKLLKGSSSRESNKILNISGKFWQDESFDRLVRDDIELYNIINYVLNNPVKADLIDDWQKWPYTYCCPDYL